VKAARAVEWDSVFAHFPGSLQELAEAVGVTRQALYQLRELQHSATPTRRLKSLASAWNVAVGEADAPSFSQILAAWKRAKTRALRSN
jgi:DNA-binding Xre family transcriptional regulator